MSLELVMQLMNKLKIILQSNYVIISILVLVILITILRINLPVKTTYNLNTTKVTGILLSSKIKEEKVTIMIKGKDKIQGTYYFKTNEDKKTYQKEFQVGNKVTITGKITLPKTNTTKNLFNYQEYLKKEKIYLIMQIEKISKEEDTISLFYKLKNKIETRAKNPYIKSFLLGDQSEIKEEVKTSFQKNGISHLFAISGMQFIIIEDCLSRILKKLNLKEKNNFKIVIICLLFYLSILNITASILRGILFFILFSLNRYWNLALAKKTLITIAITITLLINPYYIYEVGFWYSYIISIGLIYFMKEDAYYLISLLKSSYLAFLFSIPISLYYFYEINIASILYNLFYIPFINMIVFPASIITFLFPVVEPLYNIVIKVLETSSLYLNNINFGKLIFARIPLIFYIVELSIIFLYLKTKKKKILLLLLLGLGLHYYLPSIYQKDFIKMIDVGQGDSILIYSKGKSSLIDTGGKVAYDANESSTITKYTTIPLLKSLGIKKLNYLFLTHGDKDHAGEAIYLEKDFQVDNIYLNLGQQQILEQNIRKEIPRTKQVGQEEIFQTGNFTLYQINKKWEDENTGSSVFYVTHPDLTVLLMADATTKTESYLQKNYNLKVDIVKIGHHGSNTSTSLSFLKKTKPRLALISVGENNRYHHPSKEVLDRLSTQNIPYLQTKTSGTITIYPQTEEVVEDIDN